ncbi:MAG TPA: UDP-N-acetylmuramoyl-tripeptide--D-alanyl-D-alanine ligase, partial [Armatimonadetes bacterium]|nr:UDP-N-acetylmuramoyl-tripeptide--D-alanyl-D-alanine ligase [Armatimonadota bacterium]
MVEAEVWRIAQVIGGVVVGEGDPHAVVRGVAIDSRKVRGGEAFFALKGERRDGHLFVDEAFAKGAVCAVVERLEGSRGTRILVKDTLRALARLAEWWRGEIGAVVVAITGSVGKTTTKELTAAALGEWFSVHKSPGTYNTEIGLPLTILSAPRGTEVLVTEMAMRGPGQIRELCRIARPKVGVVTRVGRAHLEFFGSEEEIALAKGELIESLPEDGVAVLRADDWAFGLLKGRAKARVLTFAGAPDGADFWPRGIRSFGAEGVEVRADTPVGAVRFKLMLPGRENGINALAALAVAYALGVPLKRAVRGLERVEPLPGRLKMRSIKGVKVIDDTYNASPES